ncbi:hypothetical protein [Spiroplasma poulsonii]|uniref:hypothetical protein n=1 Tax=Spiroplasma poulsonii TaxID=2138 RepID=UPI001F4D0AAF|nr:hypothetical protein [Spiroplasma poulsonii]UNF61145.1 hypothetical protein MNU24_04300 [Spiroplasma poulsonii]
MIILMIKLLLLMPLKTQSNAQKRQNNLIRKENNDQNTSNYRTRNQKITQQVFARKNMIMLYLKNQKSKF